jgi:hypothetical protein
LVVALIGLSAGLATFTRGPASGRTEDARAALLVRARRLALDRAQPLTLQLTDDGAWTLRAPVGDTLQQGMIDATGEPMAVQIDALGSCRPLRSLAAPSDGAVFDPLRCTWAPEPGTVRAEVPR